MAYTSIAASEIDQDSPFKNTLAQKYRDNLRAGRRFITGFVHAEESITATGWSGNETTGSTTWFFRYPDRDEYTGFPTKTVTIRIEAKCDPGHSGAQIRLIDEGAVEVGPAVGPFTNTSYEWKTMTLDWLDAWRGDDRIIRVQINSDGTNACYVRLIDAITVEVTY